MTASTTALSTDSTTRAATVSGDIRTFEVRVEVPSGLYNQYRYDLAHQAFRLEAVVRPERELPADCGSLVGTLGSDGRPLPVLLLVTRPTIPGCLVDARVIGGIEHPAGETTIVGVPEVDPAFAELASYRQLSAGDREAIESFVRELALEVASPAERARWLDPEEATELVREGQRAARVAAAANRKIDTAPAWQVLDPVLRKLRRSGEGEAHSEAEYSVLDLPPRFQRHVADCLAPEERILHFVSRPEMAVDSRLSFLRSRRLNDGVLVATDRQVLWMTDALPPDSTLVDWGYLATSIPVERLHAVRLDESGATLRLEVEAWARRGSEVLSMEFARSSADACRHLASVIARFVPAPDSRALRRIYEAEPVESDLSLAAAVTEPEALKRLEMFSEQALPAGEEVLARALAPASADHRRGASLLVVTWGHVVLLEDRRAGPAVAGSWAIEDISSAEVRYSILGSRLRLVMPADGRREQLSLDSESPGAFGPMHQAFRVLLPLLANPGRVSP